LDLFTEDPNSCINLLPSPNSNVYPFVDPSLLISTCSSMSEHCFWSLCFHSLRL
jgi:hypothetical protein